MSVNHRISIASGHRTLVSIDGFHVPDNRITILLGESGIGKSLLSKAVYGLLDPDELTVRIDGQPYREYLYRNETRLLQQESFFVFQEPSTHLNPLLPLKFQIREGSLHSAKNEQAVLDSLWKNALNDVRNILDVYPKPHRPSGGEKQRILLAMAFKKLDALIARRSPLAHGIFVFDEPTGSLDNVYRDLFLEMLFDRYRKMPFTCLLITHDYSMIGKIDESHKDVMSKISFKELLLKNNGLVLNEFDPELYLEWLSQQQPSAFQEGGEKLLLEVESGAAVFGRRLVISRSRNGEEVSLRLNAGEILYLKAASGVGKTTLVKLIMGLMQADQLAARMDGLHLTHATPRSFWHKNIWGRKMTMVFQHADEALNPESSVKGVFAGLPALKQTSDADISRILRELFDTGLDSAFLNKKVKHLSGGQKQRLNLLRGFALETDVLILDEPLNGLDFESAGKVIAMLQRMQRAGKAIFLISHNEEIFDRLVREENVYYLRAEEFERVPASSDSLPENR